MNRGPVLDSSALLALILGETGAAFVDGLLAGSQVSAVTLTETLEVLTRKGDTFQAAQARMHRILTTVAPFHRGQAEAAASLLTRYRRDGLSLGDAACLALAIDLEAEVLTADRIWAQLDLPVAITLIR